MKVWMRGCAATLTASPQRRMSFSLASSFGVVPEEISAWNPLTAPQAIVMQTKGNTGPGTTNPLPSMNCVTAGMWIPGRNITTATTNLADRTVYVRTTPGDNKLTVDPFGYPAYDGNPPKPPTKLNVIQAERPMSEVWFLVDADQKAFPTAGWVSDLPPKPVHRVVRNFIYFDGHVATRKVKPSGL